MRYEPRFLLGRGSMGEVWVGLQRGPRGFERPVVLKRARAGHAAAAGLDADEALVREAHLLSLISHPNVVTVIDLAKTPSGLVLVLELVRGVSLRRWVTQLAEQGRAHSVGVAARLVSDVARGLEAARRAADLGGREAAIVHRDVNPENLLVSEHGVVKLLDFGVARSALRERTVVPTIKGKLRYLSPEQVEGGELDWRSDVFALGAVLYELLTARQLFAARDAEAVMDAIAMAQVADLPDVAPAEVRGLWRRMMTRDARGRPAFGEVSATLDAVAAREGVGQSHVVEALRRDAGATLDALAARLSDLAAMPSLDLAAAAAPERSVASALDAWSGEEATVPDGAAARGGHA